MSRKTSKLRVKRKRRINKKLKRKTTQRRRKSYKKHQRGGNLVNANNSQYSGGFGSDMGAVTGCVGCNGCGAQKGGGNAKIEAQNQMGPAGYGVNNLNRNDNILLRGAGYPVMSAFNGAKRCFNGGRKLRRKLRRKSKKSRKLRRKKSTKR
tara:strand:- start:6575 stop:7027 length:453 start_codon:yes stop_codon:yes gene_type:complete